MSADITSPTEERNLPDPRTGEAVDILRAPTEQLADMLLGAGEVRSKLGDIEKALSEELVSRMDRDATWTWHGAGMTVSAQSPTAGTEEYPPDALETALRELVDAGAISSAAAAKALQRRVTVVLDVPWSAQHIELATLLKEAPTITLGGVQVELVSCEPSAKVMKRGVTDLRKVSGTVEVLDGVKIIKDVGARRAKVERIKTTE
jgi:hypothetical protein